MKEFIDIALDKKAEPDDVDFLIQSPVLDRLKPKMREAAKVIRRAILDGRSILVRHHADADGICAGVAMEKAVIPYLKANMIMNLFKMMKKIITIMKKKAAQLIPKEKSQFMLCLYN